MTDHKNRVQKTPLPEVAALPADSLLDSFGVRVAFNEQSGPYGGWQSPAVVGNGDITPVLDRLTDLGIRHVREGIKTQSNTSVTGAMVANQLETFPVVAARGMKFISSLGNIKFKSDDPPVQAYLDWVLANFPNPTDVFEYFEGPNEPNQTGAPASWPADVAWRVKDAYIFTRTNPKYAALSSIPLVNASIQGGPEPHQLYDAAAEAIGGGVAARNFIDFGCYHIYCGHATGPAGDLSVPSYQVTARNGYAKGDAGGKNCLCTESGMFDVVDPTKTQTATYHPADVQRVYGPRIVLEHFLRGEERYYWFQFLDKTGTDSEDHMGLVGYGPTYPVKPSYTAMKYLFDLTKDPGNLNFDPRPLNMTVTGAGSDYRQVLLKKRGGKRYLCMWRDVCIWDNYTLKPVDVAPTNVSVTLGAGKSVALHNPSQGTARPLGWVSGFTVPLSGEVIVAEVG